MVWYGCFGVECRSTVSHSCPVVNVGYIPHLCCHFIVSQFDFFALVWIYSEKETLLGRMLVVGHSAAFSEFSISFP